MNDDVFSNGYLEIYDNTLKFKNNIVQLKNVERISVAPIMPRSIPQWCVIALIAGIICLTFQVVIAILLILIGGGYMAYIASENNKLGYYLRIELNSGKSLYFDAKDKEFLEKIMYVMSNCFNKSNSNIVIDMKNSEIKNVQIGDRNMMNNE